MSNKPIKDMIETIEHFAQTQPTYPVYNVLGQEHTYGDLKADSDSLAAAIDRLGLPEKSPVVVFGGQEYEMLATFVALTKSGHAYIPIDSHSALERVSAIVEVAEPSLIIAISDFPLEQVSTPMLTLAQVQEAFAQVGQGLSQTPEKVTSFQQNLDMLIPGLSGLLLTLLCMYLLKKKVSPIVIILALFAVGIVAHYFKIM